MASTGKKGKKTKGKTLALNDFLQENSGTPSLSIRKTNLNWAEEVEDSCDQYDSRPKTNVVLPTAPKASRGFDEFSEKIPHQPPFIAYLSNLPYDVNEDEITEFFGDLKISNLRIPKDERPGEVPRLKGFGYVEFEDRESLVGALSITDCTLKNRRIRIEIATNSDNERRRGGRMDNNRDRSDRSEITSGDWRSGPRSDPPPDMERNSRGGGGFNRDRDNAPQDRERGGGGGGSWRDGGDRPSFRDQESRGFHREGFGDRGRFNERDGDRRGYGSRRNDREDREFTRGSNRSEPASEPRTRPRLVLAPRSKPVEAAQNEPEQPAPPVEPTVISVPASSSSIFGNAKPVDTSARERQIEDKLAKEKSQVDGRDRRRDDWGKRDDEDGKMSRRKDSPKRTSPRRGSPKRYTSRRDSPESKRDYSPDRRNGSSNSRRSSLDRKDGKWSPGLGRSPPRRDSPDGRQSPSSKNYSPERKNRSPERRRASPHRRNGSPDSKWGSSDNKRRSPNLRRESPNRRNDSPPHERSDSPPQKSGSPYRRRESPEKKWGSSERRRASPERRRSPDQKRSPERAQLNRGPMRRNDDRDKRVAPRNDKNVKAEKEKSKEKLRDNHDRELPKLKEPEPPSFTVTNKYAFLKTEDDSD